jgi:hypothetical protein
MKFRFNYLDSKFSRFSYWTSIPSLISSFAGAITYLASVEVTTAPGGTDIVPRLPRKISGNNLDPPFGNGNCIQKSLTLL